MGSQAAAAVVCELAAFPGRDTAPNSIDSTRLDISPSSLSVEAVATAWCVTLYLYTGLDTISFQTRTDGIIRNRASEIGPDDNLATITTRIHDTSLENTEVEHRNNTAVIFDSPKNNAPQDFSERLWQGVDVALYATQSSTFLAFRTNFIAPEEAQNLAETFRHVLQIVIANNSNNGSDSTKVRDLTISPTDLQNIVQWNSGQLVTANVLVHEEFSRMASRQPDTDAIDAWDGNMSYSSLERASSLLAHHLRFQKGVGPGSWVLVCFAKSRWAIVSMLAVLKAGAAFVPVDPRFPELRVRQILQTTGASHALVCAEDTSSLMRRSDEKLQVIDVSETSVYEELYDAQEIAKGLAVVEISPQSPAIALFTSGSTGTPKGIIAPHAAVCTGAWGFGSSVGASPKTRFLQFASFMFDMSYADIITALLHGSALCIPSEDDRMGSLQEYIQRSKPTWANLTPTVARMLDPTASSSIEKLLLAGEMVKDSDTDRWLDAGVEVFNVYGPAENIIILAAGRITRGRAANVGGGKNTRLWVANVEQDRLVPVGAIGELVVEGPQVAPGYLNDSERTRASFLEDLKYIPSLNCSMASPRRYYRTGDLVRQFADGSMEIIGRADNQVKIGGQRVELNDIEAHIDSKSVVVLLPKAGHLANRLTAILEHGPAPADGDVAQLKLTRLDSEVEAEVRARLEAVVPSYMVPSVWLAAHKLPVTTSNKLDRKTLLAAVQGFSQEFASALLSRSSEGENEEIADDFEFDDQQNLLRDACSRVLNLSPRQVNLSRSFFDLGGDSITAMQVASFIRTQTKKQLAVRYLLLCPSLLGAAAHIQDQSSSLTSVLVEQAAKSTSGQQVISSGLSPMQKFFVETAQSSSAWNHYNQNVLLRVSQTRDVNQVEAAVAGVIERHPMLRSRFKVRANGDWSQMIATMADENFSLEHHPNLSTPEERQQAMKRARESLDLFAGPVVRAQLLGGGDGTDAFLFIVAHHIVVDLVSWRVIVEELEASLDGSSDNAKNKLFDASKQSLPFYAWLDLQATFSKNLQPLTTIPQQPQVPPSNFTFWDIQPSQNVYKHVRESRTTISHSTTKYLLHEGNEALQTEPVDILLASIFLSFMRAFPERDFPAILNEGHGREPWDDQLDISRTVGWFTTIHPVYLSSDTQDPIDIVRRIKDWRKATSSKGFPYFSSKYLTKTGREAFGSHLPAEILFNYEGRYQSLEHAHAILKPESWTAGEELADMGPSLQRFCLFELSASILADGKLHWTSAWNTQLRHQERITRWLESLLPAALEETIASLLAATRQFTLHDVGGTVDLRDYSEVDALTDSVLRIPGVQSIADVEAVLRGTPIQDSLAVSQSKAGSDAYEIDFTWKLSSSNGECGTSLEADRLAAAWWETVAAHPTLRTVFLEATSGTIDGMLHQVVLKRHEPCLVVLPRAESRDHALAMLEGYPSYREEGLFADLKPPHRLLICPTVDGGLFVRLQVNHIVLDGMSIPPLLLHLAEAYDAAGSTKGHKVGQLQLQPFSEFVGYIRDPERRTVSLKYWKSYLAGAQPCAFPPLLDPLPASVTAKEQHQHNNQEDDKTNSLKRASAPIPISVSLTDLQAAASKLQVTVPTLIHLAWALVLRLYTGEQRVIFGSLCSGRDAPIQGIEDAIGPFLAMLPCLVDFGSRQGNASLSDLLRQVQQASTAAMDHQACSLAEMQSALGIPGGTHLFNSGISFLPKLSPKQQTRAKYPLLFDTVAEKDPTEFDLSLFVELDDEERSISMHLDYFQSAISSAYTPHLAASIDHMLSELVRDPSRTPEQVCSLSSHDLSSVWRWNTPLIPALEKCAHEIFAERAAAYPDSEAIYSWDGSMTYAQLDDASTRLAHHLVSLDVGLGPEKLVPVCFEKSKLTVVVILAILKAGAGFVLLDSSLPTTRLWNMVCEISPCMIIASHKQIKAKGLDEKAGEESPAIPLVQVDADFISSLPPSSPSSVICSTVTASNIVYAVFTSGTTGKPKGTLIPHRALATGLREHADATGMGALGPSTRSLQFASYSFDASIGDIFTTIEVGGCLCIPSEEERTPADIIAFIARSRANWAGITPSFAALLNPATSPTLQKLCLAGEPLPPAQVNAWVDAVQLINMYGPTECTIACVANSAVSRQTGASNIGKGYRAATWVVREDDHEVLCPVGTIGELLIEGPVLARGYLDRPEQTAKVFIDAPSWLAGTRPESRLYKTGDLVRYSSDGSINYIGRKDTQVKINGQRVEVGEIESVLSTALHAPSSDGTEDGINGPIVVELLDRKSQGESHLLTAFVCVGDTNNDNKTIITTNEDTLARFRLAVARILHPQSATSTLPRYMVPQAFVPVNYVPLSSSGKTDRRALRTAAAELTRDEIVGFTSGLAAASQEDLQTESEILLAGIWQKVLKVEVVGRHNNFFRLGGDSLSAMALRAEARRAGFVLSVGDIFANPDISDMAEVLVSMEDSSSPVDSSASEDAFTTSSSSSTSDDAVTTKSTGSVEHFSLLAGVGIDPTEKVLDDISRESGISLGDIEDIFPCTPMQEALMALTSSKSREGAYTLLAAFKLPVEGLDLARFLAAWEQVAREHSLLRSRIVARPEASLVLVAREPGKAYSISGSSLEEHLAEQRRRGFGYNVPLFRLGVFVDTSTQTQYFMVNAHHSIYDGWSMRLIWESALAIYRQTNNTDSHPGLSPSLAYQSFVKELSALDRRPAEDFWRDSLSSCDPSSETFDFPLVPSAHKPIARSTKAFSLFHNIHATRSLAITPSELINAAWAVTLAQYSTVISPSASTSSVIFGVTLSGRDSLPLAGIETLVGPTITTVPRILHIHRDQSVSEFLRHVQATAAATLPHQYLGLDKIQALTGSHKQGKQAAASGKNLFTSLLVVTPNAATDSSFLSAVGIEALPLEYADFHPYPLVLECGPRDDGISVQVSFDPDCIDEAMLDHVMEQLDHNLKCISAFSSSLTLSAQKKMADVLGDIAPIHLERIVAWNTEKHQSSPSSSLLEKESLVHELVAEQARQQPSRPALASHTLSLSYAELDGFAENLSCQLYNLVASSQDKTQTTRFVGVYMDKSAAAVVAMLAILKAGLAFMPLSPSQPLARTKSLLEAAGASVVVVSPNHIEALSGLAETYQLVPVDLELKNLLNQQQNNTVNPISNYTSPSQSAYMLYTSGTTGKPKGVIVNHSAWTSAIASQQKFFSLSSSTRIMQFSSYTFDVSLFEIFATLSAGGCVCVPSEQERLNDLAGAIRALDVNSLSLTPTVARLLPADGFPDVELVVFAGEALGQADIDAWLVGSSSRPDNQQKRRRIVNAYGPTEACIYASVREVLPTESKRSVNIGQSIGEGVDLWVAYPGTDILCPIGAIGELCIGGAQLAAGYHDDEATTTRSFTNSLLENVSGWKFGNKRVYRTGDLVRYLSDGSLDYFGRRDGQVKLRGQRIDLGEIEHHCQLLLAQLQEQQPLETSSGRLTLGTIQLHKPVDRPGQTSLVVLLIDTNAEKQFAQQVQGIGFESLNLNEDNIASYLARKLRGILPSYMVPSSFIALERLPSTTSGKLDGRFIADCLDKLVSEHNNNQHQSNEAESAVEVPFTPEQALLRGWWARALDEPIEAISLSSDFFNLGGNSLSAIKLVSAARAAGHRITYDTVFTAPTLADMAATLSLASSSEGQAIEIKTNKEDEKQFSHKTDEPFDLLTATERSAVLQSILPQYNIDLSTVEDVYPTTPFQEGGMVHFARSRWLYLMVVQMNIPAHLFPQLQRSWTAAFAELELLRTRIVPTFGARDSAYQVLMKTTAQLDWHRAKDVQGFMEWVYNSHGYGQPLARVGYINSDSPKGDDGANDNIVTVLFSASHAVYDGWSLVSLWNRIFSQEALAQAADITITPTSSIQPTGARFKEYIRHHMSLDPVPAITFWRKKLKNLTNTEFPPVPATLPADHITAASSSVAKSFTIPSRATLQRLGVTVATLAQAAWSLTVAHLTNNPDTVVRLLISGRDVAASNVPAIDTIMGPITTGVPYRAVIDWESNVLAFLAAYHTDNRQVAQHAYIGMERISRINNDCQRGCAFNSLFNFQAMPWEEPELEEDEKKNRKVFKPKFMDENGFEPHRLTVDCTQIVDTERVHVTFNYDPVFLEEKETGRLLDVYLAVLEKLVATNPARMTLKEIRTLVVQKGEAFKPLAVPAAPATTEEEQARGTNQQPSSYSTIQTLVRKQVEANPFQSAIELHNGTTMITYIQLEDLSSSLADALILSGRRGSVSSSLSLSRPPSPPPSVATAKKKLGVVGILFEPSQWAVVAMLGVFKAGGVVSLLGPLVDGDEGSISSSGTTVQRQIEALEIDLVLTSTHYAPLLAYLTETRTTLEIVVVDQNSLPPPMTAFLKPAYASPETTSTGSSTSPSPAIAVLAQEVDNTTTYSHAEISTALLTIGDKLDLNAHSRSLHRSTSVSSPLSDILIDVFAALVHGGTVCISPSSSSWSDQVYLDLVDDITALHCTVASVRLGSKELAQISSKLPPSLETISLIRGGGDGNHDHPGHAQLPEPTNLTRWASDLLVLRDVNNSTSSTSLSSPSSWTQREKVLARAWGQVLGFAFDATAAELVAAKSGKTFFELGGNSLLAMRMCALLSSAANQQSPRFELTVVDVFKNPTLGAMAAVMVELGQK